MGETNSPSVAHVGYDIFSCCTYAAHPNMWYYLYAFVNSTLTSYWESVCI